MDAIGFVPLLLWALAGAGILGVCIYAFMEYQAFLLRTQVDGIPGGLRFTARDFSIEAHYGKKEIEVKTKSCQFTRHPLPSGDATVQTGSLTATLPVAGLQMQVFRIVVKDGETPKETGHSTLVFNASDEMTLKAQGATGGQSYVLRINQVPAAIAADFQRFANTLHTWISKVEGGLAAEVEVLRLAEEAKAKAEAAAAAPPKEDLSVPLTDEERNARSAAQIAGWREAAGFKGSSSEVSVDPRGHVIWFIDLDQRGRITLHANKRTVHSTLKGAKVTALSGELELSVRDEYWSEEEPELTTFRVLTGVAPEVRQAWKERLEILIQSMVRDAGIGK
jgi:hypothetical protein